MTLWFSVWFYGRKKEKEKKEQQFGGFWSHVQSKAWSTWIPSESVGLNHTSCAIVVLGPFRLTRPRIKFLQIAVPFFIYLASVHKTIHWTKASLVLCFINWQIIFSSFLHREVLNLPKLSKFQTAPPIFWNFRHTFMHKLWIPDYFQQQSLATSPGASGTYFWARWYCHSDQ